MIPVPERGAVWAAIALAALLLWTPLPFASVTPGGVLIVRLAAFLSVLPILWSSAGGSAFAAVGRPLLGWGGLAVLGVLQALPWPMGLAVRVAPRVTALNTGLPGEWAADANWVRLSLAPAKTWSVVLTLVAACALLIAAAAVGRRPRLRALLLGAGMSAGAFQLAYGLRQVLSGTYEIWGRPAMAGGARLRGTFVNPDNLAVFLEILLAVAIAWTWWGWRRARKATSLDRRILLAAPPTLCAGAALAGILATGSRAAVVATAMMLVAQGGLAGVAARTGGRGVVVGSVAAVAAGIGVVAAAGGRGIGRLLGTSAYDIWTNARFRVWDLCLELWRQFPWTGSGLGTFEDAFYLVQPRDLVDATWTRAHNDYLELLVVGGAVGVVLAFLGALALFRGLWRGLRRGARSSDRATALAALGAAIGAGVHAVFDFGLSTPANLVLFAVLQGLALGVPRLERRRG